VLIQAYVEKLRRVRGIPKGAPRSRNHDQTELWRVVTMDQLMSKFDPARQRHDPVFDGDPTDTETG
jgi:hypothetical protein